MAVEINPGVNVIDMIEAGMAKAAEAKAAAGTSKDFVGNTIVLLKDGQRAYVRPLYNMQHAIYRLMHDKYKNADASLKANEDGSPASLTQFCGRNPHINQPCKICAKLQTVPDPKLDAKAEIFVPVYLHKLVQVKVAGGQEIEEIVSYEDKQANTFKPVQGFRLLRCKMGSPVLSQLMKVYRDPDYNKDVTGCVFTIDRVGSDMNSTKYTCSPKPPTPMAPQLKAATPALERFAVKLDNVYPALIIAGQVQAAPPAAVPAGRATDEQFHAAVMSSPLNQPAPAPVTEFYDF